MQCRIQRNIAIVSAINLNENVPACFRMVDIMGEVREALDYKFDRDKKIPRMQFLRSDVTTHQQLLL